MFNDMEAGYHSDAADTLLLQPGDRLGMDRIETAVTASINHPRIHVDANRPDSVLAEEFEPFAAAAADVDYASGRIIRKLGDTRYISFLSRLNLLARSAE